MSFEAKYALEASETSTGLFQPELSGDAGSLYKSSMSRTLSKRRSTYADLLEASPESTMRVDPIGNMLEESTESRTHSDSGRMHVGISHPIGTKTREHQIVDLSQIPASSLTGMETPPRTYSENSDGIKIEGSPSDPHKYKEIAQAVKDSLIKGSFLKELVEAENGVFGAHSDISPEVSLSLNKTDSKSMDGSNVVTTGAVSSSIAGSGLGIANLSTVAIDNRPKPSANSLNLPPSGRPSVGHQGSYLAQGNPADIRPPLVATYQTINEPIIATETPMIVPPQKRTVDRIDKMGTDTFENDSSLTGVSDVLGAVESYGVVEGSGRSFKPYPKLSSIPNTAPLYSKIVDRSERNRNYYAPVEIPLRISAESVDAPEMIGSGLASILDNGIEIQPTQSQIGQVTQFLESRRNTPFEMIHQSLGDIKEESSTPHSVGTPLMRQCTRPSSASMTHYPGHPINRTPGISDSGPVFSSGYQPLPDLPSSLSQSITDFIMPRHYDYYSHPVYAQSPQNRPTSNPFSSKDAVSDVYRVAEMDDEMLPAKQQKPHRSRSAQKHPAKSGSLAHSRASSRSKGQPHTQSTDKVGSTHALASSIISKIGMPISSSGMRSSRSVSRRGEQKMSRRSSNTHVSVTSSTTRLNTSKNSKALKKSSSGSKSSSKKRSGSHGASAAKAKSPMRKRSQSKKVARSTSTGVAYTSKQTSMISESANNSFTEPEVDQAYATTQSISKKYPKYDMQQLRSSQDMQQSSAGPLQLPGEGTGYDYTPKNNENWPLIPQQKAYAQSAIGTVMGAEPMFPPRSANQGKSYPLRDGGPGGQTDDAAGRRSPSAGRSRGRSSSRQSSRSMSRNSSFTGSRPLSATAPGSVEYPTSGRSDLRQEPITINSLMQRDPHISPQIGLVSQTRGSLGTQNDRLHDDLRNLIKQKLVGMTESAVPDKHDRDETDKDKLSKEPIDLRSLKGVYSRNYEHIHDNVVVTAEGRRYKVVGYNPKL